MCFKQQAFQAAVICFPRDTTSTKRPASLCRERKLLWDHRSHNHTVSCLKFYCKIGKKGEKERKSPSKRFLFDTYLYLTVTLKKRKVAKEINNKINKFDE